jgi:nitroreductase
MEKQMIESLIGAMPVRHSVRTFLPDPVGDGGMKLLERFWGGLSLPFPLDAKMVPFEAEPGKKLYNNGINPASNIALMSQTDLLSISKTGFAGELLMLYAVSLGLGTCWFGHYKLAEAGRHIDGISSPERIKESTLGYGYGRHVDVGERVICCMPVGRADESSKRVIDLIMRKKGVNRKPVRQLMDKASENADLPKDIEEILALASLAPSAANSQMWRFGLIGSKAITVSKPVGYRHFKWEHSDVDIGICASHIWLGLMHKGYEPKVEVRQDADRALWTFTV